MDKQLRDQLYEIEQRLDSYHQLLHAICLSLPKRQAEAAGAILEDIEKRSLAISPPHERIHTHMANENLDVFKAALAAPYRISEAD